MPLDLTDQCRCKWTHPLKPGPDPNCVRCHGTGTPVPSFSCVILANNRGGGTRAWTSTEPYGVVRRTRNGAREMATWLKAYPNAYAFHVEHPRVMCVVNVYPKAPKPDPNGPKLAGDDYTARIG